MSKAGGKKVEAELYRPLVIALLKRYGTTADVAKIVGVKDETIQVIYSRKKEFTLEHVAEKIEKAYDDLGKPPVMVRRRKRPTTVKCSDGIKYLRAGEGTSMYWDEEKPLNAGGTMRPLTVGEEYTVQYNIVSATHKRGHVSGKVIGEYAHYYLFKEASGLKTTVLKNDLCREDTKVKGETV
ncbi:hypothetical protein [Aedoeadaptatus coxii]|uniref:hypothetical protein n=1 Tax=Aedoeadaptatus coxii TaxID=755172 RepID=UPI002AD2C7DB|nr:hypothetical protein [Peptoniphilus coxii]